MTSKILSRRDLAFLLYEWLDVETLTQRPRFADHSRETFDAAMLTCEQIATDLFEPHNKKSDQNEPHFDGERVTMIPEVGKALAAFCDAGLMAAGRDYELGGTQLPAVIEKAGFAWFKAANVGTSSYPFLTIGNSNLLLAHGSEDQIERFVKPMMSGRFFGTMCLSETAGRLIVVGYPHPRRGGRQDGSFRVFGNKMWISAGEHELVREHHSSGAGEDSRGRRRAAARRQGHFTVHRAEVPGRDERRCRRLGHPPPPRQSPRRRRRGRRTSRAIGRMQRPGARRPEPQDGLSWQRPTRLLNFGEGKFTPGEALQARWHRLPGRRARQPRPEPTCFT